MMPEWANWTAKLQGTSEVHLKGKNTDLRMSIRTGPEALQAHAGRCPASKPSPPRGKIRYMVISGLKTRVCWAGAKRTRYIPGMEKW